VTFKYALFASVALLPVILSTVESTDPVALLTCHVRSAACEAVAPPPPIHHADGPERGRPALHNPGQPAWVTPTVEVAWDVGIPGYDIVNARQ
jgi:hypothetical protein